ncbi:ras-related protein Rab-9B-like [Ciona intestinalis]|uniref:small monomeric GTPase n=1 Tax=Ciona intestinalis TaxID=7719 RepID=F6ZHQ2_CIOIN|nr:ras-related protein Rab-9B-like [Ciona intestinalis]|eukprot:XP_002131619.1 ras-related protein Rab-9B-like [Ciona intestinalis]
MANQPRVLKVVLIGDGGVGKSSIMNRFITGEFDGQSYHTIGVEFLTKNVEVEGKQYTLQIWDTAGQERFKSLRTPFYRGADCCMLTYAVNDAQSFHNLKMWKQEFLYYADINDDKFPFVVLGNKVDVYDKEVQQSVAQNWCRENGGYPHIETSAKDETNVTECFKTAIRNTVSAQLHQGEASISNLTSDTPNINLKAMAKDKQSCC